MPPRIELKDISSKVSSMRAVIGAGRRSAHTTAQVSARPWIRPWTENTGQGWDNRRGLGRVYCLPKESPDLVFRPDQHPGNAEMDAETQVDVPHLGEVSAVLRFRGFDFRDTSFQQEPVVAGKVTYSAYVRHGRVAARFELTTQEQTLFIKASPIADRRIFLFSEKYSIIDEKGISLNPKSMRVGINNNTVMISYAYERD